ncbi:hypothetical protein FWK35_00027809 [Aphis craccivora]|uniref:Uncharacterized protein n=1 Tax=Aphis craccivora TaxID=307492 RepID=A0A6G0VZT5_APHCR|nr:hypothetical protein FWK35_00027809 [Aphis craccivora]
MMSILNKFKSILEIKVTMKNGFMKEKYDLEHRVLDKFAKCVQIRHAKIQYITYFTPQVLSQNH